MPLNHKQLTGARNDPGQAARALRLVEARAIMGMTVREAAAYAGLSEGTAQKALKSKSVKKAIKQLQAEEAERFNLDRTQVIKGLIEAKNEAYKLGEPGVMVQAWREIAKILGHYEPQKHELTVNGTIRKVEQQMRQLPEHELAKIAGDSFIDAEYTEVDSDES